MVESDYFERDILGFCGYCKNEIRSGEDYDVRGNEMFHTECWIQKNLYMDLFDIAEDN